MKALGYVSAVAAALIGAFFGLLVFLCRRTRAVELDTYASVTTEDLAYF